jgi:hypothetical protein
MTENLPNRLLPRKPKLKRTGMIVPARDVTYGETPDWIQKATKDFLDNIPKKKSLSNLNYTKPELRNNLKKRIMNGSDGGRPGQWSARKAQLLALAYRKAGGGYRGKPSKSQRSLKKWTKERWTTIDGKPAYRKGKMSRYLPAKAWARLTPAQRRATVAKKLEGSKRGEQFVANTRRAASASASARKTGQPSHYVIKQLDIKKDKSPSNSSEGNIDVSSRKTIKLSNGEVELFKPMAFRNAGKVIVVPTITEGGKLLTESGAINKYFETGMHLGIFDDMSEAKVRIEQLEKERFKDTPKENTAKKKEDKYDRRKHRRSLAVNPATIKPVIDPKANENQPKNGVMKRSDFLAQFK